MILEILFCVNWLLVFYVMYEDMKSDTQEEDWMS